jgi:hypothetical protein
MVIGPYSYSESLYIRGSHINTKVFFYGEDIRREEAWYSRPI